MYRPDEIVEKLTLVQKFAMLFANRQYLKPLIILSLTSSSLFCVYYGMTTSVQDMGFATVQMNGIVVGLT